MKTTRTSKDLIASTRRGSGVYELDIMYDKRTVTKKFASKAELKAFVRSMGIDPGFVRFATWKDDGRGPVRARIGI